jgi:CRP/FNR family transcriptional regulator, cyclic AMP receptor protein
MVPDAGRHRESDAPRAEARPPGAGGGPAGRPLVCDAVPERRLLDATELFAALPPDVLEQLRTKTTVRALPKGGLLFSQGDPSNELFVISEGRIAIATRSSDGRESMVAVLEAGGLFGELGLFDDEPRSADARALTDSEVLALAYDDLRSVLQTRPEILWVIVKLLAQRLRATDEALADAVFLDVPARTAKRLLELAGPDDEFQLPMTQEDLAGLVGASRERVNKALAMFTRLGWVEVTGRSRYHILDREALELRANP